jgi:hypothetical protein
MPERFALYYAPATTHPLWLKAAQWLGRDAAGGEVPPAEIAGIDASHRLAISTSARRYGFHATLKAPMALAPGKSRGDLEAALAQFGLGQSEVGIGRLVLRFIDGFLAIVPDIQASDLTDFAAAVVADFDGFRAPVRADEREKRVRNGKLTAPQIALLDEYGYPYVMDEFRFHMTLTDRLSETDRDPAMAAAENWFGPLLRLPVVLDRIVLFHETEAGAPFRRLADFPLSVKVKVDA